MAPARHHRIVIVGGGTAGISVAARLRNAGERDVAVVEPSATHWYQPLWTLVGGGSASVAESARPEAAVMPRGATWLRARAEGVDPERQRVALDDGTEVGYEFLVVSPGLQLNPGQVPGMAASLATPAVSTNYLIDAAPTTWRNIQTQRGGTALFTMPSGPIKCGGAPQKIAYLAADYWRREGTLEDTRVILVLPMPSLFGIDVFAEELQRVVERYGIELHTESELAEIDGDARRAVIRRADQTTFTVDFDMAHVVPPQSAPDWIKGGPLTDPDSPYGYVQVDRHTLQHVRYRNVFALGDVASTPGSKTGAAVRKQAPVVVENLRAVMAGAKPTASYDGYSSCPITTARDKVLLAEFDYDLRLAPSFPFLDTTHERRDMWLLKRYGLPFMYWHLMLKGRA